MTRIWTVARSRGTLASMHLRALLTCVACLVAVAAFPAAGLAQTAGQAEYGGVAGTTANSPTNPPSGVAGTTAAGTSKGKGNKASSKKRAPVTLKTTDTLPFTGRDIVAMLLAGLALVGLGVVLRSATRRAPAGA